MYSMNEKREFWNHAKLTYFLLKLFTVKLRLVEVCTTLNKHRRETSYLCSVSKLVFSERAHFWNLIVLYWSVKLIFLHIQVQRNDE